jgi:hypothetical protein
MTRTSGTRVAEGRRRYLSDNDRFRLAARRDQIALDRARQPDLVQRLQLLPRLEVAQQSHLAIAGGGVPVQERHHAIAVGQRQSRVSDRRHDGKRPGGDRDADGDPEDANDAQARVADQHAPGQHEIK